MKVLLVNGSPHEKGCTYAALQEVSGALNANGIATEIFQLGTKPLSGCIACRKCVELKHYIFSDRVNDFLELANDADGFVFRNAGYIFTLLEYGPRRHAGGCGARPGGIADHARIGKEHGVVS